MQQAAEMTCHQHAQPYIIASPIPCVHQKVLHTWGRQYRQVQQLISVYLFFTMPGCSAMECFRTSFSGSMRDSNTRINVLVCSEDDRYDVMSSTHIHDRYQSATHFTRSIEVLITQILYEMATISSISHHPSPWLVELCEASMVSRAGYKSVCIKTNAVCLLDRWAHENHGWNDFNQA